MKIFVSVGTQLPFERLLNMVEKLVMDDSHQVIYQVSESKFSSKNGIVHKYLEPVEYDEIFEWCDVFISHAGMGSIITALEYGKGIIICPRRFDLGEHRNDHQQSTVNKFRNYALVRIAENTEQLKLAIASLENNRFTEIELEVEQSLISFLGRVFNEKV